jgi:iron complex outermembrane receptor protein
MTSIASKTGLFLGAAFIAMLPSLAHAQDAGTDDPRSNTTLPDPKTATSATADATVTDTAATPPPAEPELAPGEIVVTAQRRNESAQRVPISLVAVSGATLEQASIKNVLDIGKVAPGFQAQRASQAANTRLTIRGVGSSGNSAIEPSVAAFVDGVYIPRPGPLLAGLNDIAAVEVLKGPQGTLFGRNASMGAISFHTKLPTDEFSAEAGAEYQSYDRKRFTAVLNAPLGEAIKLRFAGLLDDFDGYGHNLFTGGRYGDTNLKSIRGTALIEPAANLTWTVRGDYQKVGGDGQAPTTVVATTVTPAFAAAYRAKFGGISPVLDDTYDYDVYQYTEGTLSDRQWGASSDLNLALGDYNLKLISAYRDWRNNQSELDVTNAPIAAYGRDASFVSKMHSEELQLTSPKDLLNNHLNFVAGLFLYRENYQIGEQVNLGKDYCPLIVAAASRPACLAGPQRGATAFSFEQITNSYAAYGQATVRFSDFFDVTGGVRYSHDSKDGDLISRRFNPTATMRTADTALGLKFKGGKFTYRLNATVHPSADSIIFATYSTGYKSGGFDAGNGAALGLNRVFRPELTTNYEVGFKSLWLDRRLTLNGTLFRTDVDDFQLRSFNGTVFSVRNAGSLRQQGVEFEASARPIEGLALSLLGTYLDGKYTDFTTAPNLPGKTGTRDLTGAQTPLSPKWQNVASASYTGTLSEQAGMKWTVSSAYQWQTKSDIGGAGDGNPDGIEPGYGLFSARIAVNDVNDRWELFFAGDNLTDDRYCTIRFSQTLGAQYGVVDAVNGRTPQRCVLGDPRVFRIGAKFKI